MPCAPATGSKIVQVIEQGRGFVAQAETLARDPHILVTHTLPEFTAGMEADQKNPPIKSKGSE
jgi:hypothetical protein